jgi:hypothetical protein
MQISMRSHFLRWWIVCGELAIVPVVDSERFVVITRQLQAGKYSLSCQLFSHIFILLENLLYDFRTVALSLKKRLFDLPALHWAHESVSFVWFPLVITKQLSDQSSNSSRIRRQYCSTLVAHNIQYILIFGKMALLVMAPIYFMVNGTFLKLHIARNRSKKHGSSESRFLHIFYSL